MFIKMLMRLLFPTLFCVYIYVLRNDHNFIPKNLGDKFLCSVM